jgi:putative transposase
VGVVAKLAARELKVDYRSVWSFVYDEKVSFKKAWDSACAQHAS